MPLPESSPLEVDALPIFDYDQLSYIEDMLAIPDDFSDSPSDVFHIVLGSNHFLQRAMRNCVNLFLIEENNRNADRALSDGAERGFGFVVPIFTYYSMYQRNAESLSELIANKSGQLVHFPMATRVEEAVFTGWLRVAGGPGDVPSHQLDAALLLEAYLSRHDHFSRLYEEYLEAQPHSAGGNSEIAAKDMENYMFGLRFGAAHALSAYAISHHVRWGAYRSS